MENKVENPMLVRAIKNRSAIMGLITSMVQDFDVAEEIFQNVIVAIAESKKEIDSEKEFLAWSWGVARNTVLRYWDANKRLPIATDPVILESVADAMTEDPEPDEWHQEKKYLQKCLKELPPRNRELFIHRYSDNLKGPALSEKTGMKVGSLRTTLLRVRRGLRSCIEKQIQLAGEGGVQ